MEKMESVAVKWRSRKLDLEFLDLENSRIQKTLGTFLFHQMAMSSTIPPLDWLMGFQRKVYKIGEIGMEFGYKGNDGVFKG